MATVAFIAHHGRSRAIELVKDAAAWLLDRGHEVRVPDTDADALGMPDLGCSLVELLPGLDLAVSVGGDGTMLRAVDLVGVGGVPVLGVNVGHLGYLTEVEPGHLRMALKRFLSGAYAIEERMLLSIEVSTAEGTVLPGPHTALNEVVVEKTPMGHTIRLGISIDGERFTTYAADGMIVATPTGSTAYAFSARGPIVSPTHRAILLTPVSPHMLFDRSLVFEPSAVVTLEVLEERTATVSVDGRNLGEVLPGDTVVCTAAPVSARIVTFRSREFLHILKAKFGLEDR